MGDVIGGTSLTKWIPWGSAPATAFTSSAPASPKCVESPQRQIADLPLPLTSAAVGREEQDIFHSSTDRDVPADLENAWHPKASLNPAL